MSAFRSQRTFRGPKSAQCQGRTLLMKQLTYGYWSLMQVDVVLSWVINLRLWSAPRRSRHLNVSHEIVGVANFRSSLVADLQSHQSVRLVPVAEVSKMVCTNQREVCQP